MLHWLSNNWPYLALAVVCLLGAIWFANQILGGDEEDSEPDDEVFAAEPTVRNVTDDAWSGFADAHRNNPAGWDENDSWSPNFKIPANRTDTWGN